MGRVRLPSDNLTDAQKRKLNSGVKVYRMKEPLSWEEFKTYPLGLQKEYLNWLRQKFNVTAYRVADMFKVSYVTLNKAGLTDAFKRKGPRMSNKQLEEWELFINGPADSPQDKEPEPKHEVPDEVPNVFLDQINLSYSGAIDIVSIMKDLELLLRGRKLKSFNIMAVPE